MHFSERIPVVKRHMTVALCILNFTFFYNKQKDKRFLSEW